MLNGRCTQELGDPLSALDGKFVLLHLFGGSVNSALELYGKQAVVQSSYMLRDFCYLFSSNSKESSIFLKNKLTYFK